MLYINSSFLFTDKYILLYKYTTIVVSIYLLMDIWMGLHWWLSGKESPAMQETQDIWVRSLGREHPLEEEMATHTSILAGKIQWTEKPGGLQSLGSQSQTRWSMHAWTFALFPVLAITNKTAMNSLEQVFVGI